MLSNIIQQSISAIDRKQNLQKNALDTKSYIENLKKLLKASETLKTCLLTAQVMKDSGVLTGPPLPDASMESLEDAINNCGAGVKAKNLPGSTVNALNNVSKSAMQQLKQVWATESMHYAATTTGYITLIAGLTDYPQKIRTLVESIKNYQKTIPSPTVVKSFVYAMNEAKQTQERFRIDETVTFFLRSVQSGNATIEDLTPGILSWITANSLSRKLKITF